MTIEHVLGCAKSAVLIVPSQQFWFSMFTSLWCNATSLVCSEPRVLIWHSQEALNSHQTLFLMRGWGSGHKAISLWNAQQEFCTSGYVYLLLTLVITTDWVLFETNFFYCSTWAVMVACTYDCSILVASIATLHISLLSTSAAVSPSVTARFFQHDSHATSGQSTKNKHGNGRGARL